MFLPGSKSGLSKPEASIEDARNPKIKAITTFIVELCIERLLHQLRYLRSK